MSAQSEQQVRAAGGLGLLVVGVLLGASLGAAVFPAVEGIQLSKIADQLFSFALGASVAVGVCLVIAGISALLIVPRIFGHARGTLTAMVHDLTQASRAHHGGDSAKAIGHLGRAVEEGTAWYSIVTSRRFVRQAALGLLVGFGGVLGAVLLFNQNKLLLDQNSLLRDQNRMINSQVRLLKDQNRKVDKQLRLLTDQNKKIDKQLRLLVDQNGKIEQQTMVADAQRRGAFLTEMFSILQEIANSKRKNPADTIPNKLATRIVVLTTSAAPYFYLDYQGDTTGKLKPVQRALSPERGQIIAALARMKVNLLGLYKVGANFSQADLRGIDLSGVDFGRAGPANSDSSLSGFSA